MSQIPSALAATDFITPFTKAARQVFETMLGSECVPGTPEDTREGHRMHAVTSVIGLSGEMAVGALSFSAASATACQILSLMTGMETDIVDDMVRDVMGEMANMIAGAGKRDLKHLHLDLGLPQVILGESYTVFSPRWSSQVWIPLESSVGPCSLNIGFNYTGKAYRSV